MDQPGTGFLKNGINPTLLTTSTIASGPSIFISIYKYSKYFNLGLYCFDFCVFNV